MIKKYISKICVYSLTLISLFFMATNANASTNTPKFKHIVFFGDSLTDNGNMYQLSHGLIPHYLPYFKGRFSNGYVWSDIVSYQLYQKYNIDAQNYATGGATAVLHNPVNGYLPVTLETEYETYLSKNMLADKSNTLFCIWIGGNDYLPGVKNVDTVTTNVVKGITTLVTKLMTNKGAEFLIIGLPDIAEMPLAKQKNLVENYQALYTAHNKKLDTAVHTLQNQYPNTHFALFSFLQHPLVKKAVESKEFRNQLNKTYNTNLQDVTHACWQGGFSAPHHLAQIKTSLQKEIQSQYKNTPEIAAFIQNSASLPESLQESILTNSSTQRCQHPDQHIFWDHIHPTAAVHKIFATMILDLILKKKSTNFT